MGARAHTRCTRARPHTHSCCTFLCFVLATAILKYVCRYTYTHMLFFFYLLVSCACCLCLPFIWDVLFIVIREHAHAHAHTHAHTLLLISSILGIACHACHWSGTFFIVTHTHTRCTVARKHTDTLLLHFSLLCANESLPQPQTCGFKYAMDGKWRMKLLHGDMA